MKNKKKSNCWEQNHIINGYGKFPYVILKVGNTLYMQIPIRFNKDNDMINYPGIHINGISETELNAYEVNKSCSLHEKIMQHCHWMKNKIEADKSETVKMCLVEGPKTGYYFDENGVEFSKNIPKGGILLTQDHKVIGMNVKHYL
jgi:hypothetical protein